jgi:hypothetical protein
MIKPPHSLYQNLQIGTANGSLMGSRDQVLKKHLHLHPYTSAYELKCTESCVNTGDVLLTQSLPTERIFWTSHSSWWRVVSFMRVTSTTKRAPSGQRLIGMRSRIHHYVIRMLIFDDTLHLERYCEVILYTLFGHLNADDTAAATFNNAVILQTQLVFPRHYCVLSSGTEQFQTTFGCHGRPISYSLNIICRTQWEAQFTNVILTLSLKWKKPSHIPSGISLPWNCSVPKQAGCDVWEQVLTIFNICRNLNKHGGCICINVTL